MITGIPVSNQRIAIYQADDDPQPVAVLDDDSKPLGFYGLREWQWLKACIRSVVYNGTCLNTVAGRRYKSINDMDWAAQ
jgi:hypothetical protein